MRRSRGMDRRVIPAAAVALLLLGWCCNLAGGQPTGSISAAVNATLTAVAQGPSAPIPLPTPTEAPGGVTQAQGSAAQAYALATETVNWKRKMYDPLSSDIYGFGWCDDSSPVVSSDGSSARFYFNQNKYEVSYTSGDTGSARWCAPYGTYYDFSTSITALLLDADPSASYGMVFRVYQQSNNSQIGFWLSPAGRYAVGAYNPQGNYISLQGWTPATGLAPSGQPNQLTVVAQGSQFTFYVNRVYQTSLTYNSGSTASGSIGVSVVVGSAHRAIDVEFSDFEIRVPV